MILLLIDEDKLKGSHKQMKNSIMASLQHMTALWKPKNSENQRVLPLWKEEEVVAEQERISHTDNQCRTQSVM